ncbi:MAG: 3-oxoacyl-[acyl-carrier-protein] synthase III C-terminal domain-containing protein [Desulfobacteraceae bacterium]|jgi:3-oxoacyl-[acyl-carrier-protein] synthase-3
MGTTIKTTAVSINGSTSSIDLAVAAGNDCIDASGIDKTDIEVLISIGVYHDDNIMEPAMAPLIQQRLGINPDPVEHGTMKFTFCFDLYNGACGFVNALQVADSIIKSGQAKNVLIVSADAHPSKSRRDDFPFTPVGAAVVLTDGGNSKKGFTDYFINTSGNGYEGLVGGSDILARKHDSICGKEHIELRQDGGFHEALYEFTTQSARDYIERHNIDLDTVKFLIASQPENGFAQRIYRTIGLHAVTNIVDLYSEHGNPHTSSLPLGFHTLVESSALQESDSILFVAAGSGLTSAFAMYTA